MDLTDAELLELNSMLDAANDKIRHGQYEGDEEAISSLGTKVNAEAWDRRKTDYNTFFWSTKPTAEGA
jgi:hypothetical protein